MLMSTHNIYFCWEIRKILCGYPLLSVAMYSYTLTSYPIPTLIKSVVLPVEVSNKYFRLSGMQCGPWSDAAFCGVWFGYTLLAQACLSDSVTLTPYPKCLKLWVNPFNYLLMCLKYCWTSEKQCWPWTVTAFRAIITRETIFVTSCLLSCTPTSFWKVVYSKRRSESFLFGIDPFSEGRQNFW